MAMFLSTILAIPLGMIAALKQDTWVDYVIRVFSIAGLAPPHSGWGIIIIMLLLIVFKWLPPMEFTPLWKDPGEISASSSFRRWRWAIATLPWSFG